MTYIFIGPPASGKGTQAQLLADKLGAPFYSIGAILRQQAKLDPELTKTIESGKIVNADRIRSIVDNLAHLPTETLVIDGVIRNQHQADEILTHWNRATIIIIIIDLPDTEIFSRSQQRILNGQKRKDDRLSVVKNRIKQYRTSLPKIREIITKKKIKIIDINGLGTIDSVHRQIMAKL